MRRPKLTKEIQGQLIGEAIAGGAEIVKLFPQHFAVGDWVWCLHCERCYQVGEFRVRIQWGLDWWESLQLCPYSNCEGDAVIDAWAWGRVLAARPEYPVSPERNKVYRLYV